MAFSPPALLHVHHLTMVFGTQKAEYPAVEDLCFTLSQGKTLGIVGESGSGKTMASLSIMGLLPKGGAIKTGEILLEEQNLLKCSKKEWQKIRGKEISMIFQDPMMSLDQVYTIGNQLTETMRIHEKITRKEARQRALVLLGQVGIPHPERVYRAYPFQLSGGMCQRVMIAIALCCHPKLLIADEPTTALDVTVQAQILDLLKKKQLETNMGIVLITHDLGVISEIAHDVVVMYAGKSMEIAPTQELLHHPKHPYTEGLIQSMPKLNEQIPRPRLTCIEGMVPDLKQMPKGCRFSTRCPYVEDICLKGEPDLRQVDKNHWIRCHMEWTERGHS